MVSPGNPLKHQAGMAPLADRIGSARRLVHNRHMLATGIEATLGVRYTFDTLRALRRRFPRVRFVWLMGADNLVQLPHWQRWRALARLMPFAVLPRPSYNHRALAGQAARTLRPALRPARAAPALVNGAPAWTFLPARQNPLSATALRLLHAWPAPPLTRNMPHDAADSAIERTLALEGIRI